MSDYEVQRSLVIPADPTAIHALIDDFHQWVAWSPWEGLDPAMTRTYTGPASGPGASYAWRGNRKAGEGSMTIHTSTPERIALEVKFLKPFKATNPTRFDLRPTGGGTEVTWTMNGRHTGVAALIFRFVSMDRMIGRDFEKGLSQLSAAATR